MDSVQLVFVAVFIGLISAVGVLFFQQRRISHSSGSKSPFNKPSFLILGLSNSGKTALYYKIVQASCSNDEFAEEKVKESRSEIVSTVSSIEPNITTLRFPIAHDKINIPYQVIDYPGHLKLTSLLNKLMIEQITLKKIRGIMYVIDLSSLVLNNEETVQLMARQLFQLLSKTERLPTGIDFCFAVNKQDLFDAKPVFKVRELLETELNKIIHSELEAKTQNASGITNNVEGNDDNDDEDGNGSGNSESVRDLWVSILGRPENTFRFDMLEGNMDFLGGSVLKNKVDAWENWFDEKLVNN
ncbi:uncharacterized protein KQ657_004414 [Scheffersomyces spartinae]|uniref:Signal recognition particle receptor subunit beta n=1 Tax=Scheffersomyces spartinae TaxID=45513 RepID=A0A9P7VBH3_9ASCO|nr:uncharacterized protein KQ657_004414 [Scheffersomyces spartinae]KAG7194735.1 hypothetical protein KQ657_004414 [Scheffersomyces spartinae]